jgi:hypothetical protein
MMNYYNYFTEIEEHFARRRGKHLYISPLDWHLIEVWRNSGVPLHVALRGIDMAMDHYFAQQHRSGSRLSTLAYCHDGVMAEFERHIETHLGEAPEESQTEVAEAVPNSEALRYGGPEKPAVLQLINERIMEIKDLLAKHSCEMVAEGIQRTLARLEEIARDLESDKSLDFEALERDLALLDSLLIAELQVMIPQDRMSEWEHEAKGELKLYKKRLPKETYLKIHESFIRRKIHSLFSLGELSIFRL